MADLQDTDPLVEAVAKARKAESQRPDIKFPTGTLNQISGHVYAYSGRVDVDNNWTDVLTFSTKVDALDVKFSPSYSATDGASSSVDFTWRIYFNDIRLTAVCFNEAGVYANTTLHDFIIPPNTRVRIECKNTSSSATLSTFTGVTGRVI